MLCSLRCSFEFYLNVHTRSCEINVCSGGTTHITKCSSWRHNTHYKMFLACISTRSICDFYVIYLDQSRKNRILMVFYPCRSGGSCSCFWSHFSLILYIPLFCLFFNYFFYWMLHNKCIHIFLKTVIEGAVPSASPRVNMRIKRSTRLAGNLE